MHAYDPDVRKVELASKHVDALTDALMALVHDPSDAGAWSEFARRAGHLVIFVRVHVRSRVPARRQVW
jgi:hypothetical protein